MTILNRLDLKLQTKCKYCDKIAVRYCEYIGVFNTITAYCCEECYQKKWASLRGGL
jgi:hypothetical protein